ncbi:hypothetical protein BKA70DRAFT_1221948 [Coprinopsis sp. MPI-PUGE-AT-0042]|nr:hypothetical protein BKA70DRAFT_1221948 [Coprinopsis sp. MPI-PUGE-AT-0042]
MPAFPTEIFHFIIGLVWQSHPTPDSLASLRLVCQAFAELASPMVFHRIVIRNNRLFAGYPAIQRVKQLLALSSRNPSLFKHFKALHFYINNLSTSSPEKWLQHPAIEVLIRRLRAAENLRELAILSVPGISADKILALARPIAPQIVNLFLRGVQNITKGFFTQFIGLKALHIADGHCLTTAGASTSTAPVPPRLHTMTFTSSSWRTGLPEPFFTIFDLSKTLRLPFLETVILRSWGGITPLSAPFSATESLFPLLDAPMLRAVRLDAIFRFFRDDEILAMDWAVVDKQLALLSDKQGALVICLRFIRFPDPVFYPAPFKQVSHKKVAISSLLPFCDSKSNVDLIELF